MNLGYHFDLIREAMLAMAEEKGSAQFSSDAVDLALLGNSYNDIFQVDETRMLVNDAFFRLAKIVVENTHYDRLPSRWHNEAYTRQLVQNTLKVAETACAKNDPAMLLIGLGMSMHIIQDFYSHSNWAELETYRFFKPKKDPTLFELNGLRTGEPDDFAQSVDSLGTRHCGKLFSCHYSVQYGQTNPIVLWSLYSRHQEERAATARS